MQPYLPYLDWIKDQSERIQLIVKKWVNINSFSTNLTGLKIMLEELRRDFSCLNGEERLISLPPRNYLSSNGHLNSQELGQALSIRKRANAPIQVFLGGHMDTVYPPSTPFQLIEDESQSWKGPGTADMKGGLGILLISLEALERSPYKDQIGWEVLITPDEEIGSPGSTPLFEEAAKNFLLALLFEPSFSDGAFVSRRKGSANFSVTAHGRTAHVGRDFNSGRNAISALSHFIYEVHKLNESTQDLVLNVGHIEGGGPVNVVPDLAFCRLNARAFNHKELLLCKERLEQIASQCQKAKDVNFQIYQESLRLPKQMDVQTELLYDFYATCAKQLNLPFQLRETGGVCDGNILAAAGLPTIDSLGAIGGSIHTKNEYIILSSLIERAQLTALFLLKLASQEIIFKKENAYD